MLFNESAGGEVEVVEVRITEPSETSTAPHGAGLHALVKVSAVSGGSAVSHVKYDTDSLDLPSEVEFSTSTMSVTETELVSQVADCPQYQVNVVNALYAARAHTRLGGASTAKAEHVWYSYNVLNSTEKLVLREGQGLAFVQRSGVLPHAMTVNLVLTVQSTGATYLYRSRNIGSMVSGRALWSLFNGVGSGEVIEISSIMMAEDGDLGLAAGTLAPTTLRLVRTVGQIPTEALLPEEGTSISHDTTRVEMPPGMKLLSGAFRAALPGFFEGVLYTSDSTDHSVANIAKEQRAGVLRQIVRSNRVNRPAVTCTTPDNGFDIYKAKVGQGIILRRNEGLALVGGRAGILDNSQLNYFDMRVTFVHRPATTYPVIGNNRIVRVQ